MSGILQELKRRKVFRVAAVYGVVAWLLTQVSDVVLPTFGAPVWVNQTFIFLFIVGFPIALVLAWAYDSTPEGIKPQALVQASPGLPATSAQPINYIILGIVLLVAGFQVTDRFLGRTQSVPAPRVSESVGNLPPLHARLALGDTVRRGSSNSRANLALSADGRWLAYTARLNETSSLLAHDLATGETQSLIEAVPLSSGYPYSPVFSPSGEQILFRVAGSTELSVIPRTGGRALGLGDSTRAYSNSFGGIDSADWLSEERIVFTNFEGMLEQLDIATGETALLKVPAIAGEVNQIPRMMGDSPWLLYSVVIDGNFDSARIDAFNLDSGEVRKLVANGYNGRYTSSGHLVYVRNNGLWAVTLDLEQMQIGSMERLIEDRVEANPSVGYAGYALSNNGRLVYLEGDELGGTYSASFWALSTPAGVQHSLSLPATAFHPVFSPDGEQVAVTVSPTDGADIGDHITGYIALYHIADQTLTRRTFSGAAFRPRWSPDGTQLVYGMNLDNQWGLWTQNADGSGQPQQLLSAAEPVWPDAFAPDGSALVYGTGFEHESDMRLNLLSLVPSETPDRPLLEFGTVQVGASISPDGSFIAYSSDENNSGANRDIIVRPFPNVNDGKWQVTSGDSANALWLPSGVDLFYWGIDGDIYQVAANPTNGFRQSAAIRIIDSSYPRSFRVQIPGFAVSPDGQRILHRNMGGVNSEGAIATYAVLVDNWFEKLRQVSP